MYPIVIPYAMMTQPTNLIPKQQVGSTFPVHMIKSIAESILTPKRTHDKDEQSIANVIKPITATHGSESKRTPNWKMMH